MRKPSSRCERSFGKMTNTTIQQFQFGGNPVRTVVLDSEPWFVAKDVCDVLGIATNHVRRTLDSDEIANLPIREVGNWRANISNSEVGNPGHTGGCTPLIVSEAGLYSLILTSRNPEAKDFRRWVTHEVITQRSMDLKVMEAKETVITHASGFTTTNITPKITGKGQVYFLNKFLADRPMEASR